MPHIQVPQVLSLCAHACPSLCVLMQVLVCVCSCRSCLCVHHAGLSLCVLMQVLACMCTPHLGPCAYACYTLCTCVCTRRSAPKLEAANTQVKRGRGQADPAAKLGLAQGDVITSLNGQAVASATALTDLLSAHHPGDSVQVQWTDPSGQAHTGTVKLAGGPAA